jgi:hypothetical protein
MSEKEFSIIMLEKESIIKKSASRGFAGKIVDSFLKQDGDFAEVKLGKGRKATHVSRALGRVIKNSYPDKVEYLGKNNEKNAVYLKKK